tara:strand:- start:227120 stop:228220 length:1101 start_codon:yes stop_codon:yes gene_type:complete
MLLAYNLFNYAANQFGFSFSVSLEFAISLISFFYIIQRGGLKKVNFRKYRLLLFFLLIILFSFLFRDVGYAGFKLQILLVRTVFIIFVVDLFISSGYRLNINLIIAVGIIISFILIYNSSQYGFQLRTSMLTEETTRSRIVTGVLEDSRTLAFIIALILLSFVRKKLFLIGLAIIGIGLLLTQTRQTVLALILFIVPYFIWQQGKKGNIGKNLLLLGVSLAVLIGLLVYLDVDINTSRLFSIEESGNKFFNVHSRGYLFRWAYGLFVDSPIFGHGFGFTEEAYSYPHNIILEILAELGVIGLIPFVLAIIDRFWVVNDGRIRALIIFTFFLALLTGNIAQNHLFFLALVMDSRYFEFSLAKKKLEV